MMLVLLIIYVPGSNLFGKTAIAIRTYEKNEKTILKRKIQ